MDEPLQIVIEPTANPDVMKFTVNRELTGAAGRTFRACDRDASADDPLARGLLAIPGVQKLFMLGNFLTVTRAPSADWRTLGPAVQVKLHELLR